ncbi:MAG: glycosyltransferase family 4 protein [Patescibacteria group bacterium]
MTILFFARRFYPLIGGVEKHVLEVGKRLVKKGHRVIVITEYEKNANKQNQQSLPFSATIEGIEIIRIKAGKEGRMKKFRLWLRLLRYLRVINSVDVVHCHDIFFWYLPFRFLFPLKKVYTTFHGYEGNNIPNKKAILMHKLAEKLSFGNICVGDFLKKWYGTKPTFVTYGAVDVDTQRTRNNKQKTDKNIIVFLGRLEEETGIMEYLKALKEISKKYQKLQLTVLGDGSQANEAKEYAGHNKLNAEFKGFVKNTDNHLERASFVFTSRYLGILESLVSKKYVLAVYNNEIKKDYLQMTPFANFISISKNSNEIRDQLYKYLSDEKLKNIKISNGYTWVKNQTWEKMTDTYLKLWSN